MTGRKTWAADDVLAAADLNGYLMDQVVTVWANESGRDAGILIPIEGQLCYLQDVNRYEQWNGSDWVGLNAYTADSATTAGTATYATNAGTATRLNGITIFNSSGTPTANATGDLWFY